MKCVDCGKEAVDCRCKPAEKVDFDKLREVYKDDHTECFFIGGGESSNPVFIFGSPCSKCGHFLREGHEICLFCDELPNKGGWVFQCLLGDVGGYEVLLMTRKKKEA